MPAGRPRKYTVVEMEAKIDEYFALCKEQDDIPLVTGLALHLDLHRDTLHQLEAEDREFSDILKKAKDRIASTIAALALKNKANATYAIWYGKNHLGESDKIDHNVTGNLEVDIVWGSGE